MGFDSAPAVRKRTQYERRVYGRDDKPYLISWCYPAYRLQEPPRTYRCTTEKKALEFALKHKIPLRELPPCLRTKIRSYVRTVAAIASTSTDNKADATV